MVLPACGFLKPFLKSFSLFIFRPSISALMVLLSMTGNTGLERK